MKITRRHYPRRLFCRAWRTASLRSGLGGGLVFHYADTHGLPLLDLTDLRAVIGFLTSDEGKPELKALGGLSSSTASVILRELVSFQSQGADAFFGELEFASSELL